MRHAVRVLGQEEVLEQREVALEDELILGLEVARRAAIEEQVAPGVHPDREDLDDDLLPHLVRG